MKCKQRELLLLQAEGRLDRIGDLKLLNGKNFLYRPYVQEPAPMTEDQLAEQAEVLMQLGSDVAGSEVRAKLQSANLLSDMESFKVRFLKYCCKVVKVYIGIIINQQQPNQK